jgi:hypothetical protein
VETDSPSGQTPPDQAPSSGELDPGVSAQPDRLLVVEVTYGVEVADIGASVNDIVTIAAHHDGQIYGSDVRLTDRSNSSGTVVVKLPPQNVEAMIAEVSTLGRFVTRFQNTTDVTDRVTDVATRITTAQQSVERVQRLLTDAVDLGEVVLLEGELTTRQTVLEELLAEQRNLGTSTALATLTIELSAAPLPPAVVAEEPIDPHVVDIADKQSIADAFGDGSHAFVIAGAAVLIFIGYMAPFLVLALAIGWIALVVTRRRARRNRSAAPLLPPTPVADPRTSEHDSAGAARS